MHHGIWYRPNFLELKTAAGYQALRYIAPYPLGSYKEVTLSAAQERTWDLFSALSWLQPWLHLRGLIKYRQQLDRCGKRLRLHPLRELVDLRFTIDLTDLIYSSYPTC